MIRLKIKEEAEKQRIGQAKLSRLADVGLKTVQDVFRNPDNTNITLITLDKFAKALNVDPRDLIEPI